MIPRGLFLRGKTSFQASYTQPPRKITMIVPLFSISHFLRHCFLMPFISMRNPYLMIENPDSDLSIASDGAPSHKIFHPLEISKGDRLVFYDQIKTTP